MSEMNENLSAGCRAFVGIDPGKLGALVLLWEDGREAIRLPFDPVAYRDALRILDPASTLVVLEHVGAMPGQGVTSCFSFGENFGFIRGLLEAFRLPYELVRPQKWKREFSCTSDKNTSIEVARRLFPWFSLKRTPRCTKDDDGLAEALLMAEYGRRLRA